MKDHPFDFNKQSPLNSSFEDMLSATDPEHFKFRIGDQVTVLREQWVNTSVRPGMQGIIRDYVPIVPVSDGKARSYSVELEGYPGKPLIVNEDVLVLSSDVDPEQFRLK